MGIHLSQEGLCADRSLVEVALALWNALGVTGNRAKDTAKSEEYTSKNEKVCFSILFMRNFKNEE